MNLIHSTIKLYHLATPLIIVIKVDYNRYRSTKEGKDQESIQSSTTSDPGYQWESNSQLDITNESLLILYALSLLQNSFIWRIYFYFALLHKKTTTATATTTGPMRNIVRIQ